MRSSGKSPEHRWRHPFGVLAAALGALGAWACSFDTTGLYYESDARVDPLFDARLDGDVTDARPDSGVLPTTLNVGDVRLVYGEVLAEQLQSMRWSQGSASWTMEQHTPSLGGTTRWTINKVSPDGAGEEVMAALTQIDSGYALRLLRWSGAAWVEDWELDSATQPSDTRGFDVEYEASGDLLVVYATGGVTPAYRTRTGGEWSVERFLPLNDLTGPNPDPNNGDVLWIELERRPGTDEIALAYADDGHDLVAIVWDGSEWDTDSVQTLATELKRSPMTGIVHNRVFDLAYEGNSEKLLVAWGTGSGNFTYALRLPTTGQWQPATYVSGIVAGDVHYLDLAAQPNTNRIAGGFYDLGDGTERLGLAMWSGNDWVDKGERDSQIRDVNNNAIGDAPGAVGWIGSSGVAVAIYSDDQQGTLDWAEWSDGSGWAVEADVDIATKGYTESVWLEPTPDGEDLLLVLSDDNLRLFAATYDGDVWELSNLGAALTTSVASAVSVPFSIDARDL